MKQTRNTPQKQLVRNLLINNNDHPTAEEVFIKARKKNSKISRATVYRNLNLLADSGEIRRLHMPLGSDHYDFRTDNHYHFLCKNCYKVLDAQIPYNEELNRVIPSIDGCKTEWHKLILVGLCHECNSDK